MGRTARITFTTNGNFTAPAGVTSVRVFAQQNFTPVNLNQGSVGVIASDNVTYMWGDNTSGQLGNGSVTAASSPTAVSGGYQFKQIFVGGNNPVTGFNAFGITFDGQLYSWGVNGSGQLGLGSVTAVSSPNVVLGGNRWVSLSATDSFTTAIDTTGKIYCWGVNNFGMLGNGASVIPASSPVLVTGTLPTFKQVIASSDCNAVWALSSAGVAYAWGANANGQLGIGSVVPQSSPVLVFGGLTFSTLIANQYGGGCMALTAAGVLYAWGRNGSGQLGIGTAAPASSPTLVLGGRSYSMVSLNDSADGFQTALAIGKDGVIYAWGNNAYGQLGTGNITPTSSPVAVLGLPAKTWVQVVSNNANSFALASDGSLYAWGSNVGGSLGTGVLTAATSSPVLVVGNYNFQKIIGNPSNETQAMFAWSNGQLYGWGTNTSGYLGNGTVTATSSPILVVGSKFVYIGMMPQTTTEIPVVPGTTYSISVLSPIAMFDTIAVGTAITTLVLEFDQ